MAEKLKFVAAKADTTIAPSVGPSVASKPDQRDDLLDERVNSIFGNANKRPASDESEHEMTNPKVSNAIGKSENDSTAAEDAEAIVENPPNQIQNQEDQNNSPPEDDGEELDDDMADQGDWNGGDDGNGDADDPADFPELGFPDDPPSYPEQPEFSYRYSTPGSTPRTRRIDFERSIVLRPCVRDKFTNRIPEDEYLQREDAEMKVSLG